MTSTLFLETEKQMHTLIEHYGQLRHSIIGPAVHGGKSRTFLTVAFCILYMNDDCKWSREQIADWLEAQGY